MFILKLAIRNLWRQKRRSFLTMLSMVAGFVLLSLSIALSEGGYGNVIERFTRGGTGHAQIHAQDYLDRPSLYKNYPLSPELAAILDHHPGILAYAPRVQAGALAFAGTNSSGVRVVGIDAKREAATTTLADKIGAGRLPGPRQAPNGPFDVVIGNGLARLLKVKIGERLVLVSQGADGSIANDLFTVCGILKKDCDSNERIHCYLDLQDAQAFLTLDNRIHEIALLLPNHRLSRQVCRELNGQLKSLKDLRAQPWEEVEAAFYRSMMADKAGNTVMLIIIVLIVGLGVLNTVLMSILERTREFGVLRAMGTRPRAIVLLIMTETLLQAMIASVAGIILAALCNWPLVVHGIQFGQPMSVGGITYDAIYSDWLPIAFVKPLAVVCITAIITSVLPAIRAARVKPAIAMRTY